MTGRELFKKLSLFINILVKLSSCIPGNIRNKLFIMVRGIKGKKGIMLRYILLKSLAKSCGVNVVIYENVYLFNVANITFGNNISIHPFSYIDGYGNIDIGNDVSIAHNVTIMSSSHSYSSSDVSIKYQPLKKLPVIIDSNIWIGAKAVILGGNKIATGSIVGAGAIVTHDVLKNTIVAGNPAKVIKSRINT